MLNTLGNSTIYSKIDLVSVFHPNGVPDEDIEKTPFNTSNLVPLNGSLRRLDF